MKQFPSWSKGLLVVVIIIALLVPMIPLFHSGHPSHAAGVGSGQQQDTHHVGHTTHSPVFSISLTADITLSASTATPLTVLSIGGQGFAPNEATTVHLGSPFGRSMGAGTADNNGNLPSTNITVPSVPGGTYSVFAVGGKNQPAGSTILSIIPSLTSSVHITRPGSPVYLTGLAFAASESVKVYLDSTNTVSIGAITCNTSGKCLGNVKIPAASVLNGAHLLIEAGTTSGLTAQTAIIVIPVVILNYTKGGPGTQLKVTGTGFAANESAQFFWGPAAGPASLEGSATADAFGNLSFSITVPSNATPGSYLVTAVRSKQSNVKLKVSFTLFPPTLTASGFIRNGQAVHFKLRGFESNEQVTLSWNANGGQQLITVSTDVTGSFIGSAFTPPSAASGSYSLTATGVVSGLLSASSISVDASAIQLAPNFAAPGGSITVTGNGYGPNETINVYFQTTANGVLQVNTDNSGAFTISLTVPTTFDPTISYVVYGVNASGTENAHAGFSFLSASIQPSSDAVFGQPITITGQGFIANAGVTLIWNYGQPGQVQIATLVADSTGALSTTVTAPSDANAGTVNIAALGSNHLVQAFATVQEYANILLSSQNPTAGSTVQVNGGGYGANEPVTISLARNTVATAITDATGAFLTSFTVPNYDGPGNTSVQAIGNSSGVTVSVDISVPPSLVVSPNTGPDGTTPTVTGYHFTASSSVDIYWYDTSGNATYLASATTFSTGTFTTTVDLTGHVPVVGVYYIRVTDPATGYQAYAEFDGTVSSH